MCLGFMIKKGLSFDEAYQTLKKKYNRVDPNFGFIVQLQEISKENKNK